MYYFEQILNTALISLQPCTYIASHNSYCNTTLTELSFNFEFFFKISFHRANQRKLLQKIIIAIRIIVKTAVRV